MKFTRTEVLSHCDFARILNLMIIRIKTAAMRQEDNEFHKKIRKIYFKIYSVCAHLYDEFALASGYARESKNIPIVPSMISTYTM